MQTKLMNTLTLSCKKASELIDKKLFNTLTFKERIMLRMHTTICDGCRRYKKQSVILDNLLHGYIQNVDESQTPQLVNDELKQRVLSTL